LIAVKYYFKYGVNDMPGNKKKPHNKTNNKKPAKK
jgi:hypothetical protein